MESEGQLLSGRTGELLWRIPAPAGYTGQGRPLGHEAAAPTPVADMNGDGQADVLYWFGAQQRGKDTMLAVSGVDGAKLWSNNALNVQFVSGGGSLWSGLLCMCRLLACRDIDGDGEAELVFLDREDDSRGYRLVALSTSNGAVKWQAPIEKSSDGDLTILIQPALQSNGTIITAAGRNEPGGFGIVGLDGRGGKARWRVPLAAAGDESITRKIGRRFPYPTKRTANRWRPFVFTAKSARTKTATA